VQSSGRTQPEAVGVRLPTRRTRRRAPRLARTHRLRLSSTGRPGLVGLPQTEAAAAAQAGSLRVTVRLPVTPTGCVPLPGPGSLPVPVSAGRMPLGEWCWGSALARRRGLGDRTASQGAVTASDGTAGPGSSRCCFKVLASMRVPGAGTSRARLGAASGTAVTAWVRVRDRRPLRLGLSLSLRLPAGGGRP
jgi:hypothetical protein